MLLSIANKHFFYIDLYTVFLLGIFNSNWYGIYGWLSGMGIWKEVLGTVLGVVCRDGKFHRMEGLLVTICYLRNFNIFTTTW